MEMIIILLALAIFSLTIIGGAAAIKFKKYLPYFFSFAAGSLIAVSFLDLLPESLEISESIGLPTRYIMLIVVFSFFLYSLLERFFLTHDIEHGGSHGHIMGPIGAGSLVIHSFFDGVAIGSAFYVSTSMGFIVALAVLSHNFTDGINTVTIMLKNKHNTKKAIIFLIMGALAPVLGILLTSAIVIPQNVLAIILAIFTGEFLYIGAATLLPETREHKAKKIIIPMAIAILLIMILTSIAQI